MTGDPAGVVAAAWRAALGAAAGLGVAGARAIALGWATVELDRAEAELARALDLGPGRAFWPAPRSVALGAACRIARHVLPDGGALLVLEPDTEGRLAGSLARHGEGPIAVWLAVDGSAVAAATEALRTDGWNLGPEGGGPFGRERLIIRGHEVWPRRHRLLAIDAPGTIAA